MARRWAMPRSAAAARSTFRRHAEGEIAMKRSHIVLLGAALLGAAAPAWVHHSGAMFDRNKQIEIAGAIKEFNWTNPHSSFKVEVPNPAGKLETWAIEMNSPNNL